VIAAGDPASGFRLPASGFRKSKSKSKGKGKGKAKAKD
jgi:hypothetical protein